MSSIGIEGTALTIFEILSVREGCPRDNSELDLLKVLALDLRASGKAFLCLREKFSRFHNKLERNSVSTAGFAIEAEDANDAVLGVQLQFLRWDLFGVECGVLVNGSHVLFFPKLFVDLSTVCFSNPDRLIAQFQLLLQRRQEICHGAAAGNQDLNNLLLEY